MRTVTHKEAIMMSRLSLMLALFCLVLAFPTPFQQKCYIDGRTGKMICCDNYGLCV